MNTLWRALHLALALAVLLPAGRAALSSNPPPGAIVLFDGNDLAHWHSGTRAAGWNLTNGFLSIVQGSGSLVSWELFEDVQLHLEFRFPTNSAAGVSINNLVNSGVFFQDQFEMQILESYGRTFNDPREGGSIWSIRSPDTNTSLPNGQWETYDITFHAARWTNGVKIQNARVTVYWNGVLVHYNADIPRPTRGTNVLEVPGPGPLVLQDLVGLVQFRNIWALPLTQPRPPDPRSRTLLPAGSSWRYLDDGSDQGTAWRLPAFDDTGWSNGVAELGYGDNDGATPIRGTRQDGSRIQTTYFRKHFVVSNLWALTNIALGVLRDDGAIVYLNGAEVYRGNMDPGPVDYTTWAPLAMSASEETRFFTTNIHPSALVEGTNSIAVEVHQQSVGSTDVSFNLRLTALEWDSPSVTATRTPSALVLAWPTFPAGFTLESATNLGPGALWQTETNGSLSVTNGFQMRILPPDSPARYFRLQRSVP